MLACVSTSHILHHLYMIEFLRANIKIWDMTGINFLPTAKEKIVWVKISLYMSSVHIIIIIIWHEMNCINPINGYEYYFKNFEQRSYRNYTLLFKLVIVLSKLSVWFNLRIILNDISSTKLLEAIMFILYLYKLST